jgi:hypothetical protein
VNLPPSGLADALCRLTCYLAGNIIVEKRLPLNFVCLASLASIDRTSIDAEYYWLLNMQYVMEDPPRALPRVSSNTWVKLDDIASVQVYTLTENKQYPNRGVAEWGYMEQRY